MGSKSRISKHIVPIIQSELDKNKIINYIEPFCGGLNIIDKIKCKNKYAIDSNKYLIALFMHIKNGNSLLDEVPKELYSDVRMNIDKYEDWYVGNVGFLASYNGRFFDGGYAGIVHTKANTIRDYYDESRRNLLKQIAAINDMKFYCKDYTSLNPRNALIYSDPPYQGVKQYGNSKNFNHEEFWNTMRNWSKTNIVLISEQSAPNDFECIWEQEITRTIDNNKRVKSTEKLFKIKS